jgi:hypothetical protein
MTKEELAAKLNGREIGSEISAEEQAEAKAAGLVVLYGASDDLAEFRGAIDEEVYTDGGDDILLDAEGPMPSQRDDAWSDEEMERYFVRRRVARSIGPAWRHDDFDYDWMYFTDIPHATFEIVEHSELYCRGIVFDLSELPKAP